MRVYLGLTGGGGSGATGAGAALSRELANLDGDSSCWVLLASAVSVRGMTVQRSTRTAIATLDRTSNLASWAATINSVTELMTSHHSQLHLRSYRTGSCHELCQ
jgi:hypothetical protein